MQPNSLNVANSQFARNLCFAPAPNSFNGSNFSSPVTNGTTFQQQIVPKTVNSILDLPSYLSYLFYILTSFSYAFSQCFFTRS